ncbi:MAG: hypothetical protein H0W73_06090 [Bacteroidetes bacterium]|nr:hypothetical protein [Bacteroidota bacterium]
MKTLFLSILIFLTITSFAEKLGPDYIITRSAPDNTLSKTEAAFNFTFIDTLRKPIKSVIMFSYNGKSKTQTPDAKGKFSLKVKPGKYLFQFFNSNRFFEIYTDSILIKPGYATDMLVNFRTSNMNMTVDKPVIYVYSKQKENVSIKLDLKGDFLFTYPQYSNGWNFIANPNGLIEMGDKKYHYLFWDGKINIETKKLDFSTGFIINKNDLVGFFEEKLKLMGLSSQEIEDYITYWCPRMNANEKNYIHFIFNEEYNKYASISVDPKPDHLFRVCMLWSKTNENTIVKEQQIETFKRDGFTVVEWGGSEIKDLTLPSTL